jgi:hypothetical protein
VFSGHAGNRHAPATFLLHECDRVFGILMLIEIEDHDIRALTGEGDGDRTSDATVSSRDERDLPEEFPRALVGGRLGFRAGIHLRF